MDNKDSGKLPPRKVRNKTWAFKNRQGEVFFEIEAPTKRAAFIEGLKRNVLFAGADLTRIDLSNLNLSDIDLSGCLMDATTQFTGVIAKGLNLQDSNIKGTIFDGSSMEDANFQGAFIDKASLSSVRATRADFRHAIIRNSDFGRIYATSALFSRARIHNTVFDDARMENADFSYSRIQKSSFKNTKLFSSFFGTIAQDTRKVLRQFLPDRTRGAVVLGCEYNDRTSLDSTVSAFKADKRSSKVRNMALWGIGVIGVAQGVDMASDTTVQLATAILGFEPTLGSVAIAVGVGLVVKELVSDFIKNKTNEKLSAFTDFMRNSWKEMKTRGKKRWDIMCLFGDDKTLKPLKMALKETSEDMLKKGLLPFLKFFATDHGEIILCEKEHLAKSLNVLANLRETGYRCTQPMTIVLPAARDEGISPQIIRFLPDGRSRVVWNIAETDTPLYADYNDRGELVTCRYENNEIFCPSELPEGAKRIMTTLEIFERAALDIHGLDKFSYDYSTHRIEEGRENAIVVRSRRNGRISNHAGSPAILPLSEEEHPGFYIMNGKLAAPR